MAVILVNWEETHDIRLRTGWGQTPSASYRNFGFTLIKLGNHWRTLIRHESIFVLIISLCLRCGEEQKGWQEKRQGDQ